MHLQTILNRLAALKQLADRTITAANKTEQKIAGGQLTQNQIATLEAEYENIEDCLTEMESEYGAMDEALDVIEPIVNSGLLG